MDQLNAQDFSDKKVRWVIDEAGTIILELDYVTEKFKADCEARGIPFDPAMLNNSSGLPNLDNLIVGGPSNSDLPVGHAKGGPSNSDFPLGYNANSGGMVMSQPTPNF